MWDLYNLQLLGSDEPSVEDVLRRLSERKTGVEADLILYLADRLADEVSEVDSLKKEIEKLENKIWELTQLNEN